MSSDRSEAADAARSMPLGVRITSGLRQLDRTWRRKRWKYCAAVVGWQTDNELNTTVSESYSPATLIEFQKFCRAKYTAEMYSAALPTTASTVMPRKNGVSSLSGFRLETSLQDRRLESKWVQPRAHSES